MSPRKGATRRDPVAARWPRSRTLVPIVLVAVLAAGCVRQATVKDAESVPQAEVWPTETWPSATPEAQGFDSVALTAAVRVAADGGLHSLFVARRGHVIVDAYAYPYDETLYHDLRSVTKSVLTTLVGIAVDRSELDLDTPVVSFFPNRPIADRESKAGITVRHLATMTAGLDCGNVPREEQLSRMLDSPDFVGFALDLAVVADPGTRWSYCSPGMHLLSAVLQQATGVSAAEYARENLFGPLGIVDVYWPADAQGVTHGWGDLALHPRDAAKLAVLLLRNGEWDGRQIVSHDWIEQATTAHEGTNLYEHYGYGWYIAPPGEEVFYVRADGSGGQRILVVPAFDLVMVTTGANLDAAALLGAVFDAMTAGGEPLPENPLGRAALDDLLDDLAAGPAPETPGELPAIAGQVWGRTYIFDDNPLGVQSMRLDLHDPSEASLMVTVASEASPRVDRIGLDGRFRPSVSGRPIVARGAWESEDTFTVEIDEGPGENAYELRLEFTGQDVTLTVLGITLTGSIGG